jgi:CRISPR/Cas system CMR-associated protein Cmr5 small subunit
METLFIVQYLHSLGISVIPDKCFERNYPSWVSSLPAIETETEHHVGLDECVAFYEKVSGIKHLIEKSKEFKKKFPEYRING